MSHTPTPWKLVDDFRIFDSSKDRHIAHIAGLHTSLSDDSENALFIVRAVNAFEPMREALKLAKKNLQFLPPDDVVEQIDAALALADKEQP